MSIRERLFRRPAPEQPNPEQRQLSDFHGEYSRFCGMINPHSPDEWMRRGFKDFPRLLSVDGVTHIGIDWKTVSLLVLTEHVRIEGKDGWRDIGEFIVSFTPAAKVVSYQNVTRVLTNGTSRYHHPHVLNGNLCSTATERIKTNFLDAWASEAMTSAVRCLRMRRGEITRNGAYHDLENWPAWKGGAQ